MTFNPEPVRFGGDDVGHLAPFGVPQIGLRQENSHYFDIHHSAEDTLDKVDPMEMDKAAAAWAATIWVDRGVLGWTSGRPRRRRSSAVAGSFNRSSWGSAAPATIRAVGPLPAPRVC